MAKKRVEAVKHGQKFITRIRAGRNPKKDRPGHFRNWQKEAFIKLNKKQFIRLVAATGSGKSRVQKALLHYWNHTKVKGRHLKLIVAIPQSILQESFGTETFFLPDGTEVEWGSHNVLLEDVGSVQKLIDFVLSQQVPSTPTGRVVLCTHAALVRAHQKLMSMHKGTGSPWAGVGICIDEAHHSRTGNRKEDEISNKLGQLVTHYVENDLVVGCLMLATATWMRADFAGIIPQWARDKFVDYIHPIDEHLDSMGHLKEIQIRYIVSPVDEALKSLYREDPNKKTIVYLPHTISAVSDAWGGKAGLLSACKEAFDGAWAVDLVTEEADETGEARDTRKSDLIRSIRDLKALLPKPGVAGKAKQEAEAEAYRVARQERPDVIFAMNLGKEGFDIPYLQRAVVIGPRSSPVDMYQMLGRLLRDFPDKKSVEFVVVLPFMAGEEDPEQLLAYTKTMMASMIIEWQFQPLNKKGLTKEQVAKLEAFRNDAEAVTKVMDKVTEEALRDPNADDETLLRRAVKSSWEKSDDDTLDEDEDVLVRVLATSVRAMSKFSAPAKAMVKDYDGVTLKSYAIQNRIKVYGTQFGKDGFTHLREWFSNRVGRPIAPIEMLREILVVGDLTEKQMHELAANSRRKLGLAS